jgi:hypothetical protein
LLITAIGGYYVNENNLLTVNDDGIITSIQQWCNTTTSTTTTTTTTLTTTTTTLSYVMFTLAYSNIDGATACSNYPTIDTNQYYASPSSTLTNGTIIYTDQSLTTPASNGFYSNGTNYWNTGAGSGNLQNQTAC